MNKQDVKKMVNSEKMYDDNHHYVSKYRRQALNACREYNYNVNTNGIYDTEILKRVFNGLGENVYIESNFRCELGFNITLGDNVLINHDMIILDCNEVIIGNNVYIGPRAGLYASNHAEDPFERAQGGVYSKPIIIEDNVWLGSDVKISQGVTIGKNSIIGMGSVVTKDIPENMIAAGNPCKVIRPINEHKWTKN